MARRLVDKDSDVVANFHTFIKLRDSSHQVERQKYHDYLRKAKVLVVEKIDGKREYAPSRFVGYRRNTLAAHEADPDRNGTVTSPRLESIYGRKWTYDEIEAKRFVAFCRRYGIEKDITKLNTQLKFIFSGFYTPSVHATRVKAEANKTPETKAPESQITMSPILPLNQILYGPPGTGKTYHTTVRAVGALEGMNDEQVIEKYPDRKQLRTRYEDYQRAGRIVFVTFHQAFSYEDFVEGIKPLPPKKETTDATSNSELLQNSGLQYDISDGVFKRLCTTALAATATEAELPAAIPFDKLYDDFVNQLRQQLHTTQGPLTFTTKEGLPVMLISVDKGQTGRLTFQHSTGTGQIHNQDKKWISDIYDAYQSIDQITHLKKHLTDVIGGTNASLQYVVFRELKKYETQRLTEERRKLQKQPAPRFVLIIDEINRGNVANIFGELITLLEDDKRAGRPEALTVKLPYSKEEFTVPENLYLLGTMNTADRSVEALDTALRRRFSFTEMLPDAQVLRDQLGDNGTVEGVDVARVLEALNSRLEQLLDRDHCLGHALLLGATSLDGLREAFRRNVLPLLQEYFFGDWGKIGLVLGEKFVTVEPADAVTHYSLAKFSKYDRAGLHPRPLYRLTAPDTWDAAAFQSIYTA